MTNRLSVRKRFERLATSRRMIWIVIATTSCHDKVESTNGANVTRKPIPNPTIPSGCRNSKFHVTGPQRNSPSNSKTNHFRWTIVNNAAKNLWKRPNSKDLTCLFMINLPQHLPFVSSIMPSQNVPIQQTSQNFPITYQQPQTVTQQMQTAPSVAYPTNPQGISLVLQDLLTVRTIVYTCMYIYINVCMCIYIVRVSIIDRAGISLVNIASRIEDHGRTDSV